MARPRSSVRLGAILVRFPVAELREIRKAAKADKAETTTEFARTAIREKKDSVFAKE